MQIIGRVDDAADVLDHRAFGTEVLRGQHDLAGCRDDVLDDDETASGHLTAFADLLGPVFLWLLAHEVRRKAGHRRQHGG